MYKFVLVISTTLDKLLEFMISPLRPLNKYYFTDHHWWKQSGIVEEDVCAVKLVCAVYRACVVSRQGTWNRTRYVEPPVEPWSTERWTRVLCLPKIHIHQMKTSNSHHRIQEYRFVQLCSTIYLWMRLFSLYSENNKKSYSHWQLRTPSGRRVRTRDRLLANEIMPSDVATRPQWK